MNWKHAQYSFNFKTFAKTPPWLQIVMWGHVEKEVLSVYILDVVCALHMK